MEASTLKSEIDHIVIGAEQLYKVSSQLECLLGVKLSVGGKHPLMATHNNLLKLQSNTYIEVIAIDPKASPPSPINGQPRWFSLDTDATKAKLANAGQPLCWVISVDDIEIAKSTCSYDPGEIIDMTRGSLKWRLTVPKDGSLVEDGVLPSLIEWPGGRNPANQMLESGVSLNKLLLFHPNPDKIINILAELGINGPIEVVTGKKSLGVNLRISNNKEVLLDEKSLCFKSE